MAYSKQTWDTTSYVNPTRMNHIEEGIESADKLTNLKRYRITHTSFTWNESNKYFISNDTLTNIIGNELLIGITGDFTNGSAILGWRVNNQGYIIVMGWITNLASAIGSDYQFELFIVTKPST